MKTLLKILSTAIASIILLLLGALAVLLLASDETRKQWLVAGAGYALDREVEIDGEFKLAFGSKLVLHAAEIRVGNAEWGGYPVLFQTGSADASIALWPLLKGVLDFDLSLTAPELMLETSESGVGNWDFGDPAGESTRFGLPLRMAPREINITDGRFLYRKYGVEQQDKAEIERFHLAVHEDQRILELDGHFNELPLSLKSDRAVGEGVEAEAASQLSMKGQIGRLGIQAEGTVKGSVERGDPELDLAVVFESPSLRIVSGQLGQMLPDLGPLKGKARLYGPLSTLALKDVTAQLDSAKGKLEVSGEIGNAAKMSGFDMQANAETRNMVELLKVFSVEFPIALPGKIQAEAKLSGAWPLLMLSDIKAKATDGIYKVELSGQISDLLHLDGVDFRGNINAPTLADLPIPEEFQKNKLPKIGPVKGAVHIMATDGVWSASEASIDVENENGWIRYRAEIADLAELKGLDFELQAKLQSLENLQLELLPGVAELGPIEFSAVLKDKPAGSGKLVYHGKAASGKLSVAVTGGAGKISAENGTAFDVELTADQLSDVGELVGWTLPEVGPVQYKGKLLIKGDMVRLEQFELRAGNSDLAGQLAFSMAERSERSDAILGGRLTSNTLDLSELIPEREAVELVVLEKQKMVEADAGSAASSAKLFSTDALPLEQLRQIRSRIELEVGKVITRQVQLDKLKTIFSLVDGRLTVQPFSAQIGGKPVELEMLLDASRSPPSYKFSGHAEQVSTRHVLSTITELGLEGGETSFHVDVRGEGDSIAAIAASLNGSAGFAIIGSRLTDVPVNKYGVSLLQQINPARKKSDSNILDCGAVYFEIKDGVATTPRGLAAQFKEVTWLGNGQINLATERINISAKHKARKGFGINLNPMAKLVLLSGTLTKPQIQIDPVGVVGVSAGYAAAISTGGLSMVLVGLFEKSQANAQICLQIMKPQEEANGSKSAALKPASRILKPKPSEKASATSELPNVD